ncbi:MAG TPA: efflux RND transporter periplasmic adaptor subunit [Candidatus Omnitrophota bacterium]|nr:efflux RND transporter periplasmic adaptor subunit [Candidatus Omnitrophota bacterium]HQL41927.1 efflux RND transporter periplasmic adaptor subunit [Candidatus Omnitrophota bacterium]
MRIKKILLIILFVGLVSGGLWAKFHWKETSAKTSSLTEVIPFIGDIENVISTTATVLPRNRLEIVPPVNGRIDNILVREGQRVTTGQTLAVMSSTERAALLDAARGQGEETLKYWQEVYKAIPLTSPIDADVIVSKTQAGQTVTTADAVVVLSDELIVRAQVDETDIGKVKLGQFATVTLDAYPDEKINAVVQHIYYESKTINNVTMYEVDLACEKIPSFFRSGMNATVDFLENSKKDILLIPLEAVTTENGESFVFVRSSQGAEPVKRQVQLGLSDERYWEVISGISKDDIVIIKKQTANSSGDRSEKNPFMPKMPTRKKNSEIIR